MIKFFRKIRHKLWIENKVRKYLPYAIGEIALVMIGILLALQVNNWNENRKDRNTESIILHNLLSDMEENIKQIRRKIGGCNRSQNVLITKRELFNFPAEQVTNSNLDTLIHAINNRSSFDPYVGTLNELLNSGSINVIKNEDLRRLISSWSSYLDEVRQEEDEVDIMLNDYVIPYLIENAAMADWMSLGNYGGFVNFKNYHKGYKTRMLTDLRFENLVNYSISRNKWLILRYTRMEEYLQELIELIKSELN
ncbi:MAG: DUF6090 family protein [Flavobacteriaceae bacterium]